MENPETWGRAEKIIDEAYAQWLDDGIRGLCGLSLARQIADALRREGLLDDDDDH